MSLWTRRLIGWSAMAAPALHTLTDLVEWMQGERTLMFASDYPHWDSDDLAVAFRDFPDDLRRRIFSETAREAFPKL